MTHRQSCCQPCSRTPERITATGSPWGRQPSLARLRASRQARNRAEASVTNETERRLVRQIADTGRLLEELRWRELEALDDDQARQAADRYPSWGSVKTAPTREPDTTQTTTWLTSSTRRPFRRRTAAPLARYVKLAFLQRVPSLSPAFFGRDQAGETLEDSARRGGATIRVERSRATCVECC